MHISESIHFWTIFETSPTIGSSPHFALDLSNMIKPDKLELFLSVIYNPKYNIYNLSMGQWFNVQASGNSLKWRLWLSEKSKISVSKKWMIQWWGSLDSIPGNFDFTIFLTLNNYVWWWISQEQQLFPRKAVCGLKIDFAKTTNQIRQLHLFACVDQVSPAIQMILKNSHLVQPVHLTIQQSLIQYSSVQHNWTSTTFWITHNL